MISSVGDGIIFHNPETTLRRTKMLEYIERTGTDCVKWDALEGTYGTDGLLALWVADMDFKVDSHIQDALADYVSSGVYGYNIVNDKYYDAFIDWEKAEHGLEVKREWIRYSPGVVAGFNYAVKVLTEPGDAVIVTMPVYYPFHHAVTDNGRRLINSELVNKDGRFYIDFEDFEQKIIDNDVKAFILCSPHNPVSRIWTPDELTQVLDICRRHNVAVISDEIHHDLTFGGAVHTPTLTLAQDDDRIIMFTAASKTFNIAAFRNSFAIIRDPEIRAKWDEFTQAMRVSSGNPMGYIATEAAYRYAKPWLEEVKEVIYGNYLYIKEEFAEKLPQVVMTPLDATYLAWADFSAYLKPEEIESFMQDKCRLAFDYGSWFGGESSGSFIRINLATRRENIEEMVRRITSNI